MSDQTITSLYAAILRQAAELGDGEYLCLPASWAPRAVGKSFPSHKFRYFSPPSTPTETGDDEEDDLPALV